MSTVGKRAKTATEISEHTRFSRKPRTFKSEQCWFGRHFTFLTDLNRSLISNKTFHMAPNSMTEQPEFRLQILFKLNIA
jgi:hypothetical protein